MTRIRTISSAARRKTTFGLLAAGAIAASLAAGVHSADAALLSWRTDGAPGTWTSNNWSTTSPPALAGATAWTSNSDVEFMANSAVTFATTSIGNVKVDDAVTVTVTAGGTLSTNALVRTIDVGAGSLLTWISQTASATGFIKIGAGTWNLSALTATTMTGGFTLNAGTVIASGTKSFGNGAMTINGGTLQSSGGSTYVVTGLTIGGDFEFKGTGNDTWGIATGIGAATRTITNSTTSGSRIFSGTLSGGAGAGLTFNGSGAGVIYLPNLNNTFSGPVTLNGSEVAFSGDGSFGTGNSIVLNGGRLTASTSAGAAIIYTIKPGRGIQLGNNNANSINVVPAGSLTYNGVMSDLTSNGTFTKLGSGALNLGGNHTYSGATNINAGTLTLNGTSGPAAGTLNTVGSVTVNSGGNFIVDSSPVGASGITARFGGVTLANAGNMIVKGNNNNSTTDTSAGALTLSGGSSSLTLIPGTNFASTLAFTSLTRIAGAAVNISASNMGSTAGGTSTSHILFTGSAPALSGGALNTTGAGILPYAIVFDGGAATTGFATYDSAPGVGIRALNTATEISSSITANDNVWLQLSAPAANAAVNSLTLGNGAQSAAITANGNKTLSITSGGILVLGSSAIDGDNALACTVAFAAVEGIINVPLGSNMSNNSSSLAITGSAGLTKTGGGSVAFANSNLSGLSGGITVDGGILTLNLPAPAGNYSGDTTINSGTLQLTAGQVNIPTGSNLTLGATGVLQLANNSLTLGTLNAAGGAIINNAGTGPATLTIAGSGTYAGNINQSAAPQAVSILKTSGGTLKLAGGGSSTGNVKVTAGTLSISADANLMAGSGPANVILDGGTLAASGTFTLATARGLALGPATGGGTGTIEVVSGAKLTYGGIIANTIGGTANSLVKTGPGTLALNGASTYDGATTITAGTVVVNDGSGTGSLLSSDVTVQATGVIAGIGTLKSLTLQSNAHGAPGNSVGTQSVTTLSLLNGAILDYDFGPASAAINHAAPGISDRYSVTGPAGSLSFPAAGTVTLNLASGSANIAGTGSYELLAYTDPAAVANFVAGNGTIGSILLGTGWDAVTGTQYTITNVNSGIFLDVSPVIVPEPASLAILGLGAAALLARRRRA